MKYILLFSLIFGIVGCQEPDKDELKRINGVKPKEEKVKPKLEKKSLFDTQVDSQKLQSKEQIKKEIVVVKKVDELEKQKLQIEQNIKKLELQNRQKIEEERLKSLQKQKELEQKRWMFEKQNRYKMYQIIIFLVVVLIAIVLFLVYFYKRKKSEDEILHEKEKFHREKDLELYKLQNERLEKIVDIVTTKDLSKENESILLNIISEETRKVSIIEVEPKKKGLFFKS